MNNDNIVSAAAYLFAKGENDEWFVLCGRRSGNNPRFQGGCFDVPVGMREPGESILQTATRETFEEAGIRLSGNDLRFVEKQPWGNGNVGSNFVGIFDSCFPIGNGDNEHDFFKWIPIREVGKYSWAYGMGDKIIEFYKRFINNKKEDTDKNEKILEEILKETTIRFLKQKCSQK